MKDLIFQFHLTIGKKTHFYLPVLCLLIVGYSFSAYNRTVSLDDLMKEPYFELFMTSRWGMNVWNLIAGISDLNPFVDRFLSILFLGVSAYLACCVMFYICNDRKNVFPYTAMASMFVSYPLIIEIWEYTGADVMATGNMVLCTLCLIYMLVNKERNEKGKYLIAALFLILPASSYESPMFFYVSFVCIIIYYQCSVEENRYLTFRKWFGNILYFAIPVVIAIVFRFAVSFFIQVCFQLPYRAGGAVHISWDLYNIIHFLLFDNFVNYILRGLVYLPITVFVVSLFVFANFTIYFAKRRGRLYIYILGLLVVISLFSQSFLQCGTLPYRTAQTLTLFTSFVFFLLGSFTKKIKQSQLRKLLYFFIMLICWHQSVFANKYLSLNNLRYDNESDVIRSVGQRLMSEYGNKKIVVVSFCNYSKWIYNRLTVNEKKWNEKLYYYIRNRMSHDGAHPHHEKFNTININPCSMFYCTLLEYFSYCGWDVKLIFPYPHWGDDNGIKEDHDLLLKATKEAKEMNIKPYEIKDMGEYVIVSLGNEYYIDIYG